VEEKRREYERIKKKTEEQRSALESLRISLKEKESEIKSIEDEIDRKGKRIEVVSTEIEELLQSTEDLRTARSQLEEKVKDIEAQIYHLYREKDSVEDEVRDLQAELGRLRVEEEGLGQRASDLGFRSLASRERERLFRLEREIEHLGNVNLRADEDYSQEFERYRDYESKYRKLQEERNAIKDMIAEIETRKLTAFKTAFEHINRSLRRIFSFLSPGGRAQMVVENETDPFSGGINLIVKPRGKDVQYLEAMSGGEKTLAALSLIFAIQEHKPSPFYYFDEVDAHLDEANARKVGVTLREVLASFADRLIGVSARGGVSRVFPVENLSSILREKEVS